MGLELRRDKNHKLRSKWWYGRYMIDGKRHFTNLGVEVKDIEQVWTNLPRRRKRSALWEKNPFLFAISR